MAKTDRERRPIFVRRKGSGLFPAGPEDQDALRQYPEGVELEMTVKQLRSLPQLRLYWAILHKVNEATGKFASAEHLHDAIKAKLGYVRQIKLLSGVEVIATDSAAFAAMDAQQFKEFFDKAMQLIAETFEFDPLNMSEVA